MNLEVSLIRQHFLPVILFSTSQVLIHSEFGSSTFIQITSYSDPLDPFDPFHRFNRLNSSIHQSTPNLSRLPEKNGPVKLPPRFGNWLSSPCNLGHGGPYPSRYELFSSCNVISHLIIMSPFFLFSCTYIIMITTTPMHEITGLRFLKCYIVKVTERLTRLRSSWTTGWSGTTDWWGGGGIFCCSLRRTISRSCGWC